MRRFAVILGLMLLAACTYTYRWALPPGANDQQLAQDHSVCKQDAETASQGFAGTDPWTVYEQCMAAKGYTKKGGSWEL
jgi:hypothetical protein